MQPIRSAAPSEKDDAMRIASFNVENLFERAVALNQDQWTSDQGENPSRWAAGRETLEIYSKLNVLLRKQTYTPADQAQIIGYLVALGLEKSDESKLVILRRNRGSLVKRARGAPMQVVAGGRLDRLARAQARNRRRSGDAEHGPRPEGGRRRHRRGGRS